jgi:site-specific DNA recombinase
MSQSAPQPIGSAPAEPVPVAFLGRTSTLLLQDPAASLRRQAREVQDHLPAGWFIAAWFWDVESGGLDIEQRGHGDAHQHVDVGLPRDGGLAALLAEAAGPSPRFAAVMCEDIERSGRDTFNALKLERQLADAGIPLYATDEPINAEGLNATTILTRRVKQGIAEWYRYQLKEKAWRGFEQHTLDGYNIGGAPYGYQPERIPHPNPAKAAQGRTKTRLVLDPHRAPVVAQIFTWRTVDKLGVATITNRLNADPDRYPSPRPGGWTAGGVYAILRNPKYTGHMVYGRRHCARGKHGYTVPQEQWVWSPEPTHPAIITRQVWDTAQGIGAEHASARDDTEPSTHPAARRSYLLRSRCRCRDCKRRMTGRLVRPYTGHPGYIYYDCPHNPLNPRHQAAAPGHPRTVRVREDDLLTVIRQFFATRIFGPDRAAMLAERLPATAAEDTARREQETTRLHKRLRKIDAAETAHAREIENLASLPQDSPALTALRSRIIARFGELETERAQIGDRLAALDRATSQRDEPGLLDALPLLGDALAEMPASIQARLFAAFGLEMIYNKQDHQVTIYTTITPSTPHALAGIIADSEPPATPAGLALSPQHPRMWVECQRPQTHRGMTGQRAWGLGLVGLNEADVACGAEAASRLRLYAGAGVSWGLRRWVRLGCWAAGAREAGGARSSRGTTCGTARTCRGWTGPSGAGTGRRS